MIIGAIALGVAVILTWVMFDSKNSMLGFPCVIFYAVAGGGWYEESTEAWDMEYLMFFSCMGMAIFAALGMWGLHKKGMPLEGEGRWLDEELFMDEGRERRKTEKLATEFYGDDIKEYDDFYPDEMIGKPSKRSQGVQDRARARREKYRS